MRRLALPLAALLLTAALAAACGVRPGDPCADDAACGPPDLLCFKPTIDGGPAPTGVCSFAYQPEGARCLSNADCAPGTFCSNDLSTGERQFAGTCTAAQPAGSACFRNQDCQAPLRCRGADGGLGTCG